MPTPESSEIDALRSESAHLRATVDKQQQALDYAMLIIASYERNIMRADVGVNLVGAGFCQGPLYRDALKHIEELAG